MSIYCKKSGKTTGKANFKKHRLKKKFISALLAAL
jgi:hypothetical protein